MNTLCVVYDALDKQPAYSFFENGTFVIHYTRHTSMRWLWKFDEFKGLIVKSPDDAEWNTWDNPYRSIVVKALKKSLDEIVERNIFESATN